MTSELPDETDKRRCPDDGACHHNCPAGGCFRVACCGPLSGVYPGNDWPPEIRRQEATAAPPRSRPQLNTPGPAAWRVTYTDEGDTFTELVDATTAATAEVAAWVAGLTTGADYTKFNPQLVSVEPVFPEPQS